MGRLSNSAIVCLLACLLVPFAVGGSMARVHAVSGLPSFFVEDGSGGFSFHSPGMAVAFRPGAVIYRLPGNPAAEMRVSYLGGSSAPQGSRATGAKVNDLEGADPAGWKRDLPVFEEVLYRQMWPGIDVKYGISQGALKTELRLDPGSDTRRARWRVAGADSVRIEQGALVARLGGQTIREAAPQVFEEDRVTGVRRQIAGAFRILPGHTVGITVAAHDRRNRVIFDPVIGYSTYLGGSGESEATAIAIDSAGNSVIAGFTTSLDLAPGAVTIGQPLRTAAFVAKLTAAGNQLIFCTYLGGSLDNRALAVTVDRWNNIYVAGTTSSPDFPAWKPLQAELQGPQDAFIAELNPAGNALVFSTFWGGSGVEQAYGIATDRQGEIYVTGDTQSNDYPVIGGVQGASGGGFDAFVAKFAISGSKALWSSYLGGAADEHAAAIAVDFASFASVTGSTESANFPAVNAFQPHNAGFQNGFVSRFGPLGHGLSFSTYFGGSGAAEGLPETGSGIAVDNTAAIYVTGTTASSDFPVTAGAFQAASAGGFLDAFAMKLNSGGGLVYSTYLGGVNADYGNAIAVDGAGNAHIAGYTVSPNFPSIRNVQNGENGDYDLFLTKLNSAGTGLIYSTLLGGSASDSAAALAIDRYGTAVTRGPIALGEFPGRERVSDNAARKRKRDSGAYAGGLDRDLLQFAGSLVDGRGAQRRFQRSGKRGRNHHHLRTSGRPADSGRLVGHRSPIRRAIPERDLVSRYEWQRALRCGRPDLRVRTGGRHPGGGRLGRVGNPQSRTFPQRFLYSGFQRADFGDSHRKAQRHVSLRRRGRSPRSGGLECSWDVESRGVPQRSVAARYQRIACDQRPHAFARSGRRSASGGRLGRFGSDESRRVPERPVSARLQRELELRQLRRCDPPVRTPVPIRFDPLLKVIGLWIEMPRETGKIVKCVRL